MSLKFAMFHEILNQTDAENFSAFYLDKQKRFIPKKKYATCYAR